MSLGLELVPVTIREARRFVDAHHRHNEAPRHWKFGVGIAAGGELVGVAMANRPVARLLASNDRAIEIQRVCVLEGNRNACSRLYGAACRAAAALGYRTAYTYTLEEEDAASVRAAGFVFDGYTDPRETWARPGRPRYAENLFGERLRPEGRKSRWRRELA